MPDGLRRWVNEMTRQNSGSESIHVGYCLVSSWLFFCHAWLHLEVRLVEYVWRGLILEVCW